MTTALSPPSRMSMAMIWRTAIQKVGEARSGIGIWNWLSHSYRQPHLAARQEDADASLSVAERPWRRFTAARRRLRPGRAAEELPWTAVCPSLGEHLVGFAQAAEHLDSSRTLLKRSRTSSELNQGQRC
jgi:hypothetical protein